MTLTFPESPTIGERTTTGGRTYQWTGEAWDLVGSGFPGPQGQIGPTGPNGGVYADVPFNNVIYGRRNGTWVDMTSPANLQVRRGTASEVGAITPLEGEPVWATDTKRLVVGDGSTTGGVPVGGFPLEGTAAGVSDGQSTPFGTIFATAGVELRGQVGQTTFVAGNSRGAGAVDLQMRRTAAAQVASGIYAAILGGFNNTASGALAIAAGSNATASGERSVAFNAVADRVDMHARGLPSSGLYQASVRAQEVSFVLGKLTTNATPGLMTNAAQGNLTIPSGVAMACTIEIFGVKTSDAAEAAHYIRKLAIRNVGGTTELMGSVTTVGTDYESDAGLDVAITAADATDSLKVEVTGLASTTIRWFAVVRGVELQF